MSNIIKELKLDLGGKEPPIDYEGRRRDYERWKVWSEGKGTKEQWELGNLAMFYAYTCALTDEFGNLTEQGRRYLGEAA